MACMRTIRFHCTKLDLEAFMDLMASMSLIPGPGRIYGTTSLDTGTKWRRLVPPPHFPTLWLAGARRWSRCLCGILYTHSISKAVRATLAAN